MAQTEEQKIRSRLRSYERKLEKEKKEHGFYRDGAGKRYQVGPHYLLLGDNEGALGAFQWFEKEFPDDVGEPGHFLPYSPSRDTQTGERRFSNPHKTRKNRKY